MSRGPRGRASAAQPPGPAAGETGAAAAAATGATEASALAAAAAVRGFSADLYRRLAAPPGAAVHSNLICSPYSVALALAMARAGARGRTASELDRVLHAPRPVPGTLDAGLKALRLLLDHEYGDPAGEGTRSPQVAVASSLWAQRGLVLEPAFVANLDRNYGSAVRVVDFKNAAEQARKEINAWVGARTNGKIPDLLAPGVLTPLARLVLANAIYLKAAWRVPFVAKLTELAPFRRDDGGPVPVRMMTSASKEIGYRSGDRWHAVDLPYVGGKLAMAIVVPRQGRLADLDRLVTADWLASLLRGFTPATVRLRLPRWTVRRAIDLDEPLAKLGMPTAFTQAADFSGITRGGGLEISKVAHESFIAVDEQGTEAAAATAIVFERTSALNPISVIVDRPFLFVIHDVPTGTPLFLGRVVDPTRRG